MNYAFPSGALNAQPPWSVEYDGGGWKTDASRMPQMAKPALAVMQNPKVLRGMAKDYIESPAETCEIICAGAQNI